MKLSQIKRIKCLYGIEFFSVVWGKQGGGFSFLTLKFKLRPAEGMMDNVSTPSLFSVAFSHGLHVQIFFTYL